MESIFTNLVMHLKYYTYFTYNPEYLISTRFIWIGHYALNEVWGGNALSTTQNINDKYVYR